MHIDYKLSIAYYTLFIFNQHHNIIKWVITYAETNLTTNAIDTAPVLARQQLAGPYMHSTDQNVG